MIQLEGLVLPDPKVSSPELFSLSSPDSPIVEFANAFKIKPTDVGDLTARVLTGKDKKQLVVLTTRNVQATAKYDKTDTPLIIAQQGPSGEWLWAKASLRPLAVVKNVAMSAPLQIQLFHDPEYIKLVTPNVTQVFFPDGLAIREVFAFFSHDTWQAILDNWGTTKKQLDAGVVPGGFDYNWEPSKTLVDYARQHDLPIRVQHLLLGLDAPDAILKSPLVHPEVAIESSFTPAQLAKILEFTVKVRVLQYKGQMEQWDSSDEALACIENVQGNGMNGFWFRYVGREQLLIDVARWAKQADPSIRLTIVEDHLLEAKFSDLQPALDARLFRFLERVKAEKVPITGVGNEGNLWVYGPPDKAYMLRKLRQISALGFENTAPEATVIPGSEYPIWWEPPVTPIEVTDPLIAQATLYQTLMEVYLEAGSNLFGLGDLSDAYSWFRYAGEAGKKADAMVFDDANKPKPAYYALMKTLFKYKP